MAFHMKILGVHVANGYSSEASLIASLMGPRDAAIDALFFHHVYPGDRSAETFERESNVHLVRMDMGWRPDPDGQRTRISKLCSHIRVLMCLPALLKMSRAYNPDIVISLQQRWDCFLATRIARYLRVPHVIYLCYPIVPWLGDDVISRLRTCDHIAAISGYIRGDVIRHGIAPAQVTTILPSRPPRDLPPAGTREAVRAELGLPLDAPVIGMAARLDPSKGQADTIEAFARIARSYPDVRLLMVGDKVDVGGTPREQLEAQACRTGFADRIMFLGFRRDFARILAALDIFIHPSRNEALGFAPAEASGAGLPVVAYADGGTREIILHGETGLLARPGDIAELASHLTTLLDHPALARRMGAAGRARFETHFRPEQASRAFMDLLTGISARRQVPNPMIGRVASPGTGD